MQVDIVMMIKKQIFCSPNRLHIYNLSMERYLTVHTFFPAKQSSTIIELRAQYTKRLLSIHEQLHWRKREFKGTVPPQNQNYVFCLLPVVLFISLDCFGVSCLVLEISPVEISAFFLI